MITDKLFHEAITSHCHYIHVDFNLIYMFAVALIENAYCQTYAIK